MILANRLARAAASRRSPLFPRHKRAFSWSDFNPLAYFAGGKKQDGSSGQAGGSGGQGQAQADGQQAGEYAAAGYIAPTPVVVDLRASESLIDDSEEPLRQVQNFGRMARLLFLRYRKQVLFLASNFLRSLLEDYYEYALLLFVFFVL